jgi:hypothetical protein
MIMIDSMAMPMMYVSHVNGEPRTSGSVGKSGDTEKHQFPAKRYLHMCIGRNGDHGPITDSHGTTSVSGKDAGTIPIHPN